MARLFALALALALAAALPACGGGDASMRPGDDCLRCHGFTAAGTVYASPSAGADQGIAGVMVAITDKNGAVQALTTNSAGNFYTKAAIAFPASVTVSRNGQTVSMAQSLAQGGCNGCHVAGQRIAAP